MKTAAIAILIGTFGMMTAGARQLSAPPGWKWVVDSEARLAATLDPPEGAWLFRTMAPGWHITTRPAVTLFEPTHAGRGRFTIESATFLFPGTSTAGFGLFVGGQDLEGSGRYVAFLIRRDGSASVDVVQSGKATTLAPWTKAAAIIPGGSAGDAVKNVLRIEAEASRVAFLVNGVTVAEMSRDAARPDGIVGLRIGAGLNLHVTNLDLTHRLALPSPVKK